MPKRYLLLFITSILVLSLNGCGGSASSAADTVENYLNALVQKDDALLISYICPEFEFEALLEFDAFAIVQTSLQDLNCEESSGSGDHVDVVCQGSIQATYGNEIRNFNLSKRTYHLVDDAGTWLVCGYDDIN